MCIITIIIITESGIQYKYPQQTTELSELFVCACVC